MIEVSEDAYLKEKMDRNELQSLIPVAGDDKESFVPQDATISEEEKKIENPQVKESVIVINEVSIVYLFISPAVDAHFV